MKYRKRFCAGFIFFLFLSFFSFLNADNNIKISTQISRTKISLSDTVTFKIICENVSVDKINFTDVVKPLLTNLKIISCSTASYLNSRIYEFILKPETFGMAYIDPVKINYFFLEKEEFIATPSRYSIEISESNKLLKNQNSKKWMYYIFSLIIIVIFLSFMILSHYKKKNLQNQKNVEITDPLKNVKLEITNLENNLDIFDSKKIAEKIHFLLAEIVSAKFNINIKTLTKFEIEKNMKDKFNKTNELLSLVSVLDEIKFSNGSIDLEQKKTMIQFLKYMIK